MQRHRKRTPEETCRQKTRMGAVYKTEEAARMACRSVNLLWSRDTGPVEPYQCKICGFWHKGHARKQKAET